MLRTQGSGVTIRCIPRTMPCISLRCVAMYVWHIIRYVLDTIHTLGHKIVRGSKQDDVHTIWMYIVWVDMYINVLRMALEDLPYKSMAASAYICVC